MDNSQFTFGRPQEIIRILGRQRYRQGVRIGEADVLAGKAHQASQQVQRLLAGGQHTLEIIERCIGVRPAQRFVQRRDQAVMTFAVLIVHRHPAVQQCGEAGRIERFGKIDGIERFDLVE